MPTYRCRALHNIEGEGGRTVSEVGERFGFANIEVHVQQGEEGDSGKGVPEDELEGNEGQEELEVVLGALAAQWNGSRNSCFLARF